MLAALTDKQNEQLDSVPDAERIYTVNFEPPRRLVLYIIYYCIAQTCAH